MELIEGYAENLPLSDNSVDVVYSSLVFHHLPNDIKKKAIDEMYRVLKPGGQVVIADLGESRNKFLARLFCLFTKFQYLKGNLAGLIPQYLNEAGFKNTHAHGPRSVLIDILVGEK